MRDADHADPPVMSEQYKKCFLAPTRIPALAANGEHAVESLET
jgi:hypothetical protein